MTLADAIRRAVEDQNPKMALRIAGHLRHRLGLDYAGSWELVHRASGASQAEWDALLYEGEEDPACSA